MTSPPPPRDPASPQRPPHHTPDGRFRNPWPDSGPPPYRDVLRLMVAQWRGGRASPTPPRNSFPVATPSIIRPRGQDAARGTTNATATATWIGHSTVLLQLGALNVLTDPVFGAYAGPLPGLGPRRVTDPALTLDALPPIDLVLLSHSHYDHMDRASIRHIARAHPAATWVVPLRLGRYIRAWGARDVVQLDWWQQETVRGCRIMGVPARHFSARRADDRNRTLWSGFTLETGGMRVLFAGDTAYHPEYAEVGRRAGPFDLAIMPIGAYDPRWFMHVVHVDPEESVRMYRELVSAHPDAPLPLMLGVHWGTFRLTTEPMGEPPRRTSAHWNDVGLPADRLWIARLGETRTFR